TKFLNTLPPEWSKFMTDVKLVRDLHTTNVDQLHAYLGQHEYHANECLQSIIINSSSGICSSCSSTTMDTTIDQQVAMDEALVPHAHRLRIGRSNFHLLSDIKSKESTLQLMYDVLRMTPFFKAFLVTADVLKIYMQEFWATATVHHHSIQFKIDTKKHIINLESFKEMLHICPRLPHQPFVEPPFKEEILAFLRFLRHSGIIKRLNDVNINKLHQPWRSFAAIINKCLTGKSSGYDSLRLNIKIQRRAMRCIILDERTGSILGVPDVPTDDSEEGDDDDDDARDDDDQEDKGDNDEDDEEEGSDDGKEGHDEDEL
nr:hypothetical protein [Tanacetum cinerariifolium]